MLFVDSPFKFKKTNTNYQRETKSPWEIFNSNWHYGNTCMVTLRQTAKSVENKNVQLTKPAETNNTCCKQNDL